MKGESGIVALMGDPNLLNYRKRTLNADSPKYMEALHDSLTGIQICAFYPIMDFATSLKACG